MASLKLVIGAIVALTLAACGDPVSMKANDALALAKDDHEVIKELVAVVNNQTRIIQALNTKVSNLEAIVSQIQFVDEEDDEEDCPPPPPPKKAAPQAKPQQSKDMGPLQKYFKQDQLNIVVFKEDWCPHCKRYMAAVREWGDPSLNFIIVDLAKDKELAKFRQGTGIPETHIYSIDGRLLAKQSGFSDKADFQQWFNKFKSKRTAA